MLGGGKKVTLVRNDLVRNFNYIANRSQNRRDSCRKLKVLYLT